MSRATPFLWYESEAEEAANLYCSLVPNSRITGVQRMGPDGPAFIVSFELDGVTYQAMNAGPHDRPNDSFSIFVNCEDQAEVDRYWDALTANGGEESMCGWLNDRWGFRWQIVPKALGECLGDPDPVRAGRAREAMMQMRKIDIAALQRARDGES